MPHVRMLILAAALPLTACAGSIAGGPAQLPSGGLQANITTPCDHPADVLATARDDWEILGGRLGDALLICRAKHGELVLVADPKAG